MRWWVGGALLLLATEPTFACKCAVVPRDQTISTTPLVFEGRVAGIATTGTSQITMVVVTKPIKGVSADVILKVKSKTQSAACGYDFREADKTLTIGGKSAGRGVISVHRCTMYNLNN